jgi:hypothetical protein
VVRFSATTLWHFDASEWAPSTASKAGSCTAAILSLFDHQVGAAKQRKQHGKAESDARHHAPSLRNALGAKNGRRPIVDVPRFGSDFEFEADLHVLGILK